MAVVLMSAMGLLFIVQCEAHPVKSPRSDP